VFGRSEDRDDVLFDADVMIGSALDAEDVIDGELSDTQPGALDADAESMGDQETIEAADVAIEVDSSITDLEATQEFKIEAVEGPDQDDALLLDTEPEAEAEALKSEIAEWETGILKRKKVDLEKPIYISNSIGHARNVEYIGFQSMTQPYRVYGLTYQEVLAKLHNLVKISLSENAVMKKK
jgi:hypothetical protein